MSTLASILVVVGRWFDPMPKVEPMGGLEYWMRREWRAGNP